MWICELNPKQGNIKPTSFFFTTPSALLVWECSPRTVLFAYTKYVVGCGLHKRKHSLWYFRCKRIWILHVSCNLTWKALFPDKKDCKKRCLFLHDVIINDMAVSVNRFFKCFPLHTGPSKCKFERLVSFGVILIWTRSDEIYEMYAIFLPNFCCQAVVIYLRPHKEFMGR